MFRQLLLCSLMCLSLVGFSANDNLEDINFPLNSSIVVDGFQGLDLLAAVMAKHDNLDIEVTGYTDSLGSASYNKGLSEKRAESVKSYLVSKGVADAKIKTSGEGIDNSHNNQTREGRFQNRRVSLDMYETTNGMRAKVSYPRLLELFFGGSTNMQALKELKEETAKDNTEVLDKLSDLQKQLNAMNDALQRRIGNLERAHEALAQKTEEMPKKAALSFNMGKYTGVSISAGADDDGEITGQVRGMFFKTVSDHFAVQAQGDASYYDTHEEGQADLAAVYQNGGFKMAAAGSYKWASTGFDAVRVAQGAVLADWRFESGKVGVFGTFPLADGDVIGETHHGIYTTEYFVSVPTQLGLDFGVSVGDKIDLSGYAASLDTEQSDADLAAGLNLQMLIKDQLSWYLDASMNEGHLDLDDDNMRYQLGLKLGSWNQARYNVSDQITPVNIPRVRYEILSRTMRTGNTAPVADAGQSRTDVAEGTVTLDASASSDPDGDSITFKWTQTGGPAVILAGADTATATFQGVAGNSYTFQVTVRDSEGEASTDSVSIGMEAAPIPAPVVNVFSALPAEITVGQTTTLNWVTQHADEVTISGIGVVPADGQILVQPTTTTEYTLTATNETGTETATVTVTVNPLPPEPDPVINFFTALPDTIDEGEVTTLSWSTEYAESVTISGLGRVNATGSLVLAPEVTTAYTLTATNETGSVSQEVTITVIPVVPNTAPVALAGLDQQVNAGVTVTLDGTGSFDGDGDALSYEWTQISGPAVTLNGADTANPTFISLDRGDVYSFRLVVRDGRGGQGVDEVTVTVLDF